MNSSIIPTLPLPEPVPILSSGVVGVEVVDTIRVVEAAVRRCGKSVASITAEDLDTAKTNLHFILSALSNRGVNLWAVDRQLVPVVHGQAVYTLPTGTEKIVNIMYRTNRRLTAVNTVLTGYSHCTVQLSQAQEFNLVGFKLPTEFVGRLVMEHRTGTEGWAVYRNFDDIEIGKGWHWYSFDPAISASEFRIRDSTGNDLTVEDIALYDSQSDREITRMNRDQYTSIPDKSRKGRPHSFFFDKQIEAQIVLWPVPQSEEEQMIIWRQRRIHDVGSLAQKLELPERWFEAITWALAKNLAYELQGVPADRITLCTSEAVRSLADAELGESDQSPLFIKPNISGYTA